MRRTRPLITLFATLLALVLLIPPAAQADPPAPPCFDVSVEFRGRVATQLVDNVQYYLWTYRVYGTGCINRAMGHWVLGICNGTAISSASTQSTDASDPINGPLTNYLPSVGPDPSTGTAFGLKWNAVAGNRVDKVNEYDEFSFIASGPITTIAWVAKGGALQVSGVTQGPGCNPVPARPTTWGSLKSRFR